VASSRARYVVRAASRLAWCALGAAVALALVLWLVDPPSSPLLVASFGGTAVFLFGLTRAPAAQPRALFGGHLIGALAGIVCVRLFGDAMWVYVLALALALILMLVTGTVHPPAGANPLIMVQSHASFVALLDPVAAGVGLLALVAFVWSRLLPRTVRYPANWRDRSPPSLFWGGWVE
jgi:CBS-domain-containing membrane protein